MKFNKWTVGLAALGVVSLASAAKADDNMAPAPNYLETSMKGISISGYVDTSVEWAMYPGTERQQDSPTAPISFRGPYKQDGFNMNVVQLNFEKPMDEAPAASGFKVSLIAGPDAVGYNDPANVGTAGDVGFAVKQAYVTVRAPIGNGIDFKIGVFDTIIGYEVFEAGSNPNFSRSWGYYFEPTEHEGILASYKFTDNISASFGVANTLTPGIGARNTKESFDSYWCKTWMASVTLTAPEDWGFLAGSALYVGAVEGFSTGNIITSDDQLNFYAGAVVNTPVAGLTGGFAYDFVDYSISSGPGVDLQAHNFGLYSSYKVTEKLSVHGRAEAGFYCDNTTSGDQCWWGLTGTVQYDIWENVISRVELRHEEDNTRPFGTVGAECATSLYLNMIYKF